MRIILSKIKPKNDEMLDFQRPFNQITLYSKKGNSKKFYINYKNFYYESCNNNDKNRKRKTRRKYIRFYMIQQYVYIHEHGWLEVFTIIEIRLHKRILINYKNTIIP